MIRLTTENLILHRHSREEMEALAARLGYSAFEKANGLIEGSFVQDDFSTEMFRESCGCMINDPDHATWYCHWAILHPGEKKGIGGILTKGGPNAKGEVEIGYGMAEEYQNHGYMKEALQTFIPWLLTQENVLAVTAEIEKDNIASQRVVLHAGMSKYYETEAYDWWKVDR